MMMMIPIEANMEMVMRALVWPSDVHLTLVGHSSPGNHNFKD